MRSVLVPAPLSRQITPCQLSALHFPSLSRHSHLSFLEFSRRRWPPSPKTLNYCCPPPASLSLSYGGWDDCSSADDSAQLGQSNHLLRILNSLGIDDKRYLFMYGLGFVCALAISRIKVSTIIGFPAGAVVFAISYSIGYLNGGRLNQSFFGGNKRRSQEENFRGSVDKLSSLVDLFNGFDGKIAHLENDIRGCIDNNRIKVADLEGYMRDMESIRMSALSAKNMVGDFVGSVLAENQEAESVTNQKANKRRRELGKAGFSLSEFFFGFFQKKSISSSKPGKVKDDAEREAAGVLAKDTMKGNILDHSVEEKSFHSESIFDEDNDNTYGSSFIQDGVQASVNGSKRNKVHAENKNFDMADEGIRADKFLNSKYDYYNNTLRFMNNQRVSLNVERCNELETWAFHDGLLDAVDSNVSQHLKTETFSQERTFKTRRGSYMPSDGVQNSQNKDCRYNREEERVTSDGLGSSPSSSASDDIVFNRYLTEGSSLLRQARGYLSHRGEEEMAENALYNCAELLSRAIDMKPMSLLAVGQLGNTYLLHGELKLRISRELRTLLAGDDSLSVRRWQQAVRGADEENLRTDKLASILVNVCEECEDLLVKAGRKYRFALSIDGNDMKALYNWGLALSLRAQLIADIGPKAAADADKVFLAAIDKFDAMMSKSNTHAPNALFRWAVALQQRSRLRPRKSGEKVKLLQQARRLYEDALHMDSSNHQVKEALSSCISELEHRIY